MPKVSVIIPTYNCAEYIEKAISSVLTQTYSNIEIIVVDDGSTDHTAETINRIQSDKVRYFYKENGGPGSARNYALKEAKGNIITFLDADDYFHPDNIATKMNVLKDNHNVYWLFSDVYFVSTEGAKICLGSEYFSSAYASELFKEKRIFEALLTDGNFISTATLMMRRGCFDEIGLFDESQLMHQDYLQWLHLSHAFSNYIYLDKPLVYITRHSTSWGNNEKKSLEERLKLYAKIEKLFQKELDPILHSWQKRVSDVYNRLGASEMSSNRQMARNYFLKSIRKRSLQKFAYLKLAQTLWN
jgi:glycosyltransferase involved in cell wall biosynthesis